MKTDCSHASSRQRLTTSPWLSLALVTPLSVPSAAFVEPPAGFGRAYAARAAGAPAAPQTVGFLITVSGTGGGAMWRPLQTATPMPQLARASRPAVPGCAINDQTMHHSKEPEK